MIDETLLRKHSIGKDGFVWWLGQVCEAKTWWPNYPLAPTPGQEGLPGFADRVKVSILGYHSCSKDELKNDELPWAYCLKPTTAGGSMGSGGESINLQGGEWVFGFFLDGEDGQQPVIIGCLGKSEQQDFRLELPNCRFEPFSGFTNRRAEPLTSIKRDEATKKSNSGKTTTVRKSRYSGGVKVQSKLVKEQTRLEGSPLNVSPKAIKSAHDYEVAIGEMQPADPSDCNNPMDIIDISMKRMSKLGRIYENHDGLHVDKALNLVDQKAWEREQTTAAGRVASAMTMITRKQQAATQEALAAATSNIASFAPISKMLDAQVGMDKTMQKMMGQFAGMIDGLPSEASNFVASTAGKLASQPPCVVEGYTASIMSKVMGGIDRGVNNAMSDVNSVLASVDQEGSMAKMGLGAAKALMSGGGVGGAIGGALGAAAGASGALGAAVEKAGALSSMLSGGLNSFGGITVPMDGLPKFKSSFRKIMTGEQPLPCTPKKYNAAQGPMPGLPGMSQFGSVLEKVSASTDAIQNLASGISNFTESNSIFDTNINMDNIRKDGLGGIGGIDDALKKASNLASYAKFPGTIGDSIKTNAMTMLEGGDTIDAAILAAETIFPGGGDFIKEAFGNQLRGQRTQGDACATGPTLNGPPLVDIWGGEGNGALANAVVGPNGNILAVQLKHCGKGWTESNPPYAAITDSSGRGTGAVLRAILDTDKFEEDGPGGPLGYSCIKEIEVLEPGSGYMTKPDGSVGGNGAAFAERSDTVMKDRDGFYYKAEPDTKVSLPPGSEVWFPVGTKVELPTSTMTNNGDDVSTQQAIETATSRVGNRGKGTTTYGYIDYRQLRMMHSFDYSHGHIIPGKQGAEGVGKPGFGRGVDYPRAKAEGYSDADIRYYLEQYFVPRLNGAVGKNMQKLLDDHTWGLLPVKLSGGKKKGKIKSLQVVREQGFKGFSKVTDGSRLGAGPVLSIRDAVTDRKVSNLLEFQTGNWLNLSDDHGNTGIIEMFKEAELVNIEGRTEDYGRFGTAGRRTWAQTRQEVGAQSDSNISGGGARMNVLGEKWKTLDPWRAGLEEGTRLKFRGVYNHNTGMSAEQFADPYNIEKNNYRYFIFDYEVEVYHTALGYPYAAGNLDPVKTTWYKLIDIHYVTGSEDWFNGEVIHKRMLDKAGRMYEMHIKVCTYDDEKITVTGGGLNSNSEVMEIVKTALPCIPDIVTDDFADYRQTRWYREKYGERSMSQTWGHIPGTERNKLIKEIVRVYNSFGDAENSPKTDFHNAATKKGARQYVDKKGMKAQVDGYLRYLKDLKDGKTCEMEDYVINRDVPGYSGPGVYLDLRSHPGTQTITFRESVDNSKIHHIMEIPGVGTFSEEGNLKWGSADLTQQVSGGRIYGPIRGPRARGVWIGNENPPDIRKNDLPQSLRNNKNCILEEGGDDFDDFGLSTSVGQFTRFNESPSLPSKKGRRRKKVTPLTQEDYDRYTTDFNVVEERAFKCLVKDIWKGAISAARSHGPVVEEQHYCQWATEYVEEARRKFQKVDTISYKLPCGAEFTTPPPLPPAEQPEEPRLPIRVKQGEILNTGIGYGPNDTILVNGSPADFDLGPDGRIIAFRPPVLPVVDYPEIEINSEFGAGADLGCLLEVGDPNDFPDLDPLEMVEVVDCVGKNIFIVES